MRRHGVKHAYAFPHPINLGFQHGTKRVQGRHHTCVRPLIRQQYVICYRRSAILPDSMSELRRIRFSPAARANNCISLENNNHER